MKKRAVLPLVCIMTILILDSRCAAQSARDALTLCLETLVPVLFPLFVFSAMLVPRLSYLRIPGLARLLGIPEGSEGLFILGCCGGFPVGAACVSQAAQAGALKRSDARRMLGLVSFCGPSFLFGIIGTLFSMKEAVLLFFVQLEAAVLTAQFRSVPSGNIFRCSQMAPVSLNSALGRATISLSSVCGWVVLAGVMSGFLRRWFSPLLPGWVSAALTGFLELTSGVFALGNLSDPRLRFVLCAAFVCFGGVSVLLQIGGFAGAAGLSMLPCVTQKAMQALLGSVLAAGIAVFGPAFLLMGLIVPALKIAVEISGRMVYNGPRKEGI